MEVRSIYRYAKISAFKVREVTREIQGLPVSAALDIVAFSPKKAAGLINKTLKSAVANAENNANLKVDTLVVKEATCGEGPTMKRMMTRARGSGSRILKRSSHIRIILSDEIEIKTRDKNKSGAKKSGAKKRSAGAKAAKSQSKPQQTETAPAAAPDAAAPDPNLTSRTDVNE
ncbi:MAG TPA: 50S ribosomal protein L22 [Chthoniobacterales bacterium]|nr:50S ribosomal protein L22 [Chthoniobacterales bacterium]